jgi:hypothetical protein
MLARPEQKKRGRALRRLWPHRRYHLLVIGLIDRWGIASVLSWRWGTRRAAKVARTISKRPLTKKEAQRRKRKAGESNPSGNDASLLAYKKTPPSGRGRSKYARCGVGKVSIKRPVHGRAEKRRNAIGRLVRRATSQPLSLVHRASKQRRIENCLLDSKSIRGLACIHELC